MRSSVRAALFLLICLFSLLPTGLAGVGGNGPMQNGYNIANANDEANYRGYPDTQGCQPMCCQKGNNQIDQNLNQNGLGLAGYPMSSLGSSGGVGSSGFFPQGGAVWIPQNGYNIANANGFGNQIDQNLNQNAFGLGGFPGGSGGFVWIPQNGINIANANGANNRINQNLNQNAMGIGGISFGPGGSVWIPQNGINIANANGFNNQIDQTLNQNAYGFS